MYSPLDPDQSREGFEISSVENRNTWLTLHIIIQIHTICIHVCQDIKVKLRSGIFRVQLN